MLTHSRHFRRLLRVVQVSLIATLAMGAASPAAAPCNLAATGGGAGPATRSPATRRPRRRRSGVDPPWAGRASALAAGGRSVAAGGRLAAAGGAAQAPAGSRRSEPEAVPRHPPRRLPAALEGPGRDQRADAKSDRRRPAGATSKTPAPPEPRLKVDFVKTPFWQAMDQVLDQAGLTLYPFGDDQAARIVERGGEASPRKWTSYSGPFRFEVASVAAQRDLRNPAGQVLRLEMEVAWEPRLRPIAFEHRLADLTAIDDRGRPLAVRSPQADLEVPVERGPIAKTLSIPLSLPPRNANQIARLHGTLRALVPGKMETFRFEGLGQAAGGADIPVRQEKRIAGVTVLLDPVRKGEHGWEVSILVRFDRAQGALASHRNWILGNPAFLEGKTASGYSPARAPKRPSGTLPRSAFATRSRSTARSRTTPSSTRRRG